MEMKKIASVTLIVAASIGSAMAQLLPPASAPISSPASAPAPSNDISAATASLPHVATLAGATLLSYFAYYMH